jgi:hypothetical protein
MAAAPRLSADVVDPEVERPRVFNPLKSSNKSDVSLTVVKQEPRNPKDVIRRFQEEKSYGLGRRRRTRRVRKSKKSKKSKKTRKH